MYNLFICGFLGFVASFAVILMTLKLRHRYNLTGRKDEFHHAHETPVTRIGGIAFAAAFICVAVLSLTALHCPWTVIITIGGTALAMFGLGLWDDLRALGAKRKLVWQLIIATIAYFLGISITLFKIPFNGQIIELGWWSWPATVFWLVAMTNLINLIDGVDGLAGGISLMLMLLMSVVGGAVAGVSFLAAGMAGALVAFLLFNFPPAKIYMGDGGAYFLGFLIGLLTITSSNKGTVAAALVAPLFVLALPIFDTSLAILRRGLHGLPLFRADRRHIHHQLLESGLSRRNVVLGLYAFTAFFLGLGFIVFWGRGQYMPLIMGGAILAVLLAVGRFNLGGELFTVGRVLGNSLYMRAEIQYALAQTRWLVLEGGRCRDIGELCEDTVFIARKLGYDRVHIQLEDGARTWNITPANENELCLHRQKLPDHHSAFIELGVACAKVRKDACDMLRHHKTSLGMPCSRMMENSGLPVPAAGQQSCKTSPENAGKVRSGNMDASFHKDYRILGELLAEGWAKAIAAWEKRNKLPVRFDGLNPAPQKLPGEIPGAQPLTT